MRRQTTAVALRIVAGFPMTVSWIVKETFHFQEDAKLVFDIAEGIRAMSHNLPGERSTIDKGKEAPRSLTAGADGPLETAGRRGRVETSGHDFGRPHGAAGTPNASSSSSSAESHRRRRLLAEHHKHFVGGDKPRQEEDDQHSLMTTPRRTTHSDQEGKTPHRTKLLRKGESLTYNYESVYQGEHPTRLFSRRCASP